MSTEISVLTASGLTEYDSNMKSHINSKISGMIYVDDSAGQAAPPLSLVNLSYENGKYYIQYQDDVSTKAEVTLGGYTVKVLSQDAYDALETKDSNTIYFTS